MVGNGTAGRETEEFVAAIVEKQKKMKTKQLWERVEHSIVRYRHLFHLISLDIVLNFSFYLF